MSMRLLGELAGIRVFTCDEAEWPREVREAIESGAEGDPNPEVVIDGHGDMIINPSRAKAILQRLAAALDQIQSEGTEHA